MPFNNVIPSFIMNDPEKLAKFMKNVHGGNQDLAESTRRFVQAAQPAFPGMEDYVVENETPSAQYMDELGTGNLTSTIYRIVNSRGEVERSSTSTAFNKPYYGTLKGARSALTHLRRRATGTFRLQKGEVTWQEL